MLTVSNTFILEGGNKYLANEKIESLSIEINENFQEQYEKILKIMQQNNFKILHKKHNEELITKDSRFSKTFNYIFIR